MSDSETKTECVRIAELARDVRVAMMTAFATLAKSDRIAYTAANARLDAVHESVRRLSLEDFRRFEAEFDRQGGIPLYFVSALVPGQKANHG